MDDVDVFEAGAEEKEDVFEEELQAGIPMNTPRRRRNHTRAGEYHLCVVYVYMCRD